MLARIGETGEWRNNPLWHRTENGPAQNLTQERGRGSLFIKREGGSFSISVGVSGLDVRLG